MDLQQKQQLDTILEESESEAPSEINDGAEERTETGLEEEEEEEEGQEEEEEEDEAEEEEKEDEEEEVKEDEEEDDEEEEEEEEEEDECPLKVMRPQRQRSSTSLESSGRSPRSFSSTRDGATKSFGRVMNMKEWKMLKPYPAKRRQKKKKQETAVRRRRTTEELPQWLVELMVDIEGATTHRLTVE